MAEKGMTVGSIPAPSGTPPMSIIDRFFAFLSSLKLAIFLISFVAFLSIVGTLVIQTPLAQPGQIEEAYMPATIRIFTLLGFFDVYHSWWFTSVLALLGLNLIFCTIDLFPRTAEFVKRPKLDASEYYIQGQPCKEQFSTALSDDELDRRIDEVLRKHGLKPVKNSFPDRRVFFAQKGLWWRFTVYFIHAALLVIFAGGIITSYFGFSGFVPLVEGEKSDKFLLRTPNGEEQRPFGFELQCRNTEIEFRKDLPGVRFSRLDVDDIKSVGKVHRWTSNMSVFENGKEKFQYPIIVNEPLNYRGFKIYQASFGITADFKSLEFMIKKDGAPDTQAVKFTLKPDEALKIPGTDLTATVKQFIPDPFLDPKSGQPRSRSKSYFDPRYDAPVALLNITNGEGKTFEKWALYNPDALWSAVDRRDGNPLGYITAMSNVEPRYYTGLQVSHSPGYETFVVGSFMILAALILRFFFGHRRFWVTIKKDGKLQQVYVGAHTSRHKSTLQKMFGDLTTELKTVMNAEG